MTHTCQLCGAPNAQKFNAFELESFGLPEELKQGQEHYYLCLSCYDDLTEKPLLTEEVQRRMKENRENLDKLIEEGLVCPNCKMPLLDDQHTCEI